MTRTMLMTFVSLALAFAGADTALAQAPKPSANLRIVAVDVEGGAATLFVTPEGKSLLIDAGWAPGAGSARLNAKGIRPPPAPTRSWPPRMRWA